MIKKRKPSFLCEFSETLKWAAQTGVSILEMFGTIFDKALSNLN